MIGRLEEPKLSDVLFDAALQSRFMLARRRDLQHESDGFRFIYGVDANILRYWGNPRTRAPGRRSHLGRIFRSDGNDLATSIALGLLNFIFERIGSDPIPLVIIPPMESEVASMLEALHDADPNTTSISVKRQIAQVVKRLHNALPAEQLGKLSITLQELLFAEIGEQAELRRMLLLFSRQRVKKLDDAARLMPSDLREILLPSENIMRRWAEYSDAKTGRGEMPSDGWELRLSRTSSWKTDTLRSNDAEVLSRIEVWNRHLARTSQKWRVLYLTTDLRLLEAAAEYRDFEHAEGRSFAEAYMRHPRAYLSEDGVLGSVDDVANTLAGADESVGEWLRMATYPLEDVALSELANHARHNTALTGRQQTFDDNSTYVRDAGGGSAAELAKGLTDKWRQFAQGALVANPTPAAGLLGLTADRKQPAEEMFRRLHAAQDVLESDRRATLSQYLHVTTRLGLAIEAAQSKRPIVHSVPPIYFEDWRDAGRAVTIMSSWPDGEIDEAAYRETVELLDHDDASSYAFYLGNAAYFAARDRWRSAALLARRAKGKAVALRTEANSLAPSGANGREAAYFESVCRGRLARDVESLIGARACLGESRNVLALERQQGRYNDFIEERLDIQAASLDLEEFYFAASGAQEPAKSVDRYHSCGATLWALLLELQARRPHDSDFHPGGADETRLRVEASLLVTVLSLAFLPYATAEVGRRARQAAARLEVLFQSTPLRIEVLGVFEQAFLWGGRVRDDRGRASRRELNQQIAILESPHINLLPFEPYLLEQLERTAESPWPTG